MTVLKRSLTRTGSGSPEATVLMPLRNSEEFVEDAIASVLRQENCALEVLISDDVSSDSTYARALERASDYDGPHRIVLFRAESRLGIDHLQALVDQSSCRLVIEAHGDDVSLPGRMARLISIHRETGAALITSLVDHLDGRSVKPERPPQDVSPGWVPVERVLRNDGLFTGARYAFDRVQHEAFARLDSAHAASSHDRLQAFRAALLGRLWYDRERLLQYRAHAGQGSRRMVDTTDALSARFGWSLRFLSMTRKMRADLDHAERRSILGRERAADLRSLLEARQSELLDALLEARDRMVGQRRDLRWVAGEALEALPAPPPTPPRSSRLSAGLGSIAQLRRRLGRRF